MTTKDKVSDFLYSIRLLQVFDAMTAKYTLKPNGKRKYHRSPTRSEAEVILIMILFHNSSNWCLIETKNDGLKNIAQMEYSRHICLDHLFVKSLGVIAAYCLFLKKPCINVRRTIDTQFTLFWIRRTHVNLKKQWNIHTFLTPLGH